MSSKEDPNTRTVKMEVLVLGLCRTGTLSMKLALEDLGYENIYHMVDLTDSTTDADLWLQGLHAKYDSNPTPEFLTASYFDQILGNYSAVSDIPGACFVPELLAAYPGAKVILTTRSPSSWYSSMLSTVHAIHVSPYHRLLMPVASSPTQKLRHLMEVITKHYFNGSIETYGEKGFVEHNEMVKRVCKEKGREVLVYQVGEGWERLCAFLGKEVPEREYPHVNDRKYWRRNWGLSWSWMSIWGLGSLGIAVLSGVYMRMGS